MDEKDRANMDAYWELAYNLYRPCPHCGQFGMMGVTGVCGMCTMDEIVEERLHAETKGGTTPELLPPAV